LHIPGFLVLWPRNWLVLVNHKDSPIVGKYIKDGEAFYPGSTVSFPSHSVTVTSCLVSLLVFLRSLKLLMLDGG
jgi:hypothetical protein